MTNETTICLVMIVRNEEAFIIDALESCEKWISHWIILDSHSDDETEHLINMWAGGTGIPGAVHQYDGPLHGGDKRTAAMQLAREKAEYLLMIDADNILEVVGDPFHDLNQDCYYLKKKCGDLYYDWVSLYRGDLDWKYTGLFHEFPELTPGPMNPAPALPGVIVHEAVKDWDQHGPRARHPSYYYPMALALEQELINKKDQLPAFMVHRYTFYAAQAWKDCNFFDRAVEVYMARSRMGGFDQEVSYSLYMIARIKQQQGKPPWEVIEAALYAWNYEPSSREIAYLTMTLLTIAGLGLMGYTIGAATQALEPKPFLFSEKIVHDKFFPDLLAELKPKWLP